MGKKSKKKQANGKRQNKDERAVAASPETLAVGDRVTLNFLSATEYNGRDGTVVSLPKDHDPDGRYGIRLDGKRDSIAVRARNIMLTSPAEGVHRTTEQLRKQRNDHGLRKEEHMNADQMAMMRTMMNMFMTEQKQVEIFGRKIPPLPDFCREVREAGGYAPGVERCWAEEYLRTAFEQSSNLPHMMEFGMEMPEYEPSPHDMLKRLSSNHPSKIRWYLEESKRPGSIFQERTMVISSYPVIFTRHSYSNQAYRTEMLHQGTTHVAVGFVDLGILFAAHLGDSPKASSSGPLHFLGIEASSYAVAKTLVVWEMIQQAHLSATLNHIVQAWFSCTWSEGTADTAKKAISSLLSNQQSPTYHPNVLKLLRYWDSTGVMNVQEARKLYAQETSNARSAIADLRRKCDRVAMARYELTGDFGLRGAPVQANMLMLDCPDRTAPLAKDETVFSAFDLVEVTRFMKNGAKNIMTAAEEYAMFNIAKLVDWARKGLIKVELRCSKVEDVVEDIAATKPWTMSWSNVLDYMDHHKFHHLARACSIHGDTIHFGYSMNWVCNVFGTNIIDFRGQDLVNMRKEIIRNSNTAVEQWYKVVGWDQYLRLPPPCNPINTTSHFGLEIALHKGWAEYFFSIAQESGPCQVAKTEHAAGGSPLSPTGGSTVFFTWTYDPDIAFNGLPGAAP